MNLDPNPVSLLFIERSSPNYSARRAPYDATGPRYIILHYTHMQPAEAALQKLCDPAAQVSAHYLIENTGMIYKLVDEKQRAWHAGTSLWQGEADMNSASIGIELDNPGHDYETGEMMVPYPAVQITALIALCRGIMQRWQIPPENVIGHSDVAPGRKIDPGPLFPWQELAGQGIGVWPRPQA